MIVDTNVSVSRWPFRRVPDDETAALVTRLRRLGVVQAWAGSLEAPFHSDLAAVNQRLAAECRRHGEGLLLPFGSIDPTKPGWREEVRRCDREHGMRGVRLHPNYHGYTLADRAFGEAVEAATNHKLVVQIALEMEDVRTQHPLMRVPPVSVENIAALPLEATVQFLNGSSKLLPQARRLAGDRRVYFDFAMVEGMDPVGHLAAAASIQRVAFGSYAPLFYFESALLKVREAALSEMDARRVFAGNARELLDGARRQ